MVWYCGVLLLFLSLPHSLWAEDLVWDSPATRRCFQHFDTSDRRWTGVFDTSDCPTDNPADACKDRPNSQRQAPTDDKSCPLWFLTTTNLAEADYGATWEYALEGGYGDLLTFTTTYSAPDCGMVGAGFAWQDRNHSIKDLTSTIGPNLEDLAELLISVNGSATYTPDPNCSATAATAFLEVTVRYPNQHEDTLRVNVFEYELSRVPIKSTNYSTNTQSCGTGASRITCKTVLSGSQLFVGRPGLSTKAPFILWTNGSMGHAAIDFQPLLRDRLYLPGPPLSYTYKDAALARIAIASEINGGAMTFTLRNMTATGN